MNVAANSILREPGVESFQYQDAHALHFQDGNQGRFLFDDQSYYYSISFLVPFRPEHTSNYQHTTLPGPSLPNPIHVMFTTCGGVLESCKEMPKRSILDFPGVDAIEAESKQVAH